MANTTKASVRCWAMADEQAAFTCLRDDIYKHGPELQVYSSLLLVSSSPLDNPAPHSRWRDAWARGYWGECGWEQTIHVRPLTISVLVSSPLSLSSSPSLPLSPLSPPLCWISFQQHCTHKNRVKYQWELSIYGGLVETCLFIDQVFP